MDAKKQLRQELFIFLFFFCFLITLFFSTTSVLADVTYPEKTEGLIFDGHVKATISYSKDHAPNYTAVGDKITVTTTLEKQDEGILPDVYKQSSVVILYPEETQGLKLFGDPAFTYQPINGENQTGAFIDSNIQLQSTMLWYFNTNVKILYSDDITYNGRMTQISDSGFTDGNYDDQYSLQKLLLHQGDKVSLSYQAEITKEALTKSKFTFHTAIFDSQTATIDWDNFLTVSAPKIQELGLSFDEATKNKQITVSDEQSYQTTLTGNWVGDQSNLSPDLTINGQTIPVSVTDFKEDGTFSIPVDLKNHGKLGDNAVHLKITNGTQVAEDDAVLSLVQADTPPEVKLLEPTSEVTVSPTDQSLVIKGQWKDKESESIRLFYQLSGTENVLVNSISNEKKDTWTDFCQKLPLDQLQLGENHVEIYGKDAEGQVSEKEKLIIQLVQGTISFKQIDPEMLFQDLVITGQTSQSTTQKAVNVIVEDTTGKPKDWDLTVKQVQPFSNGDQKLAAQLAYQNDSVRSVISTTPVNLSLRQINDREYSLPQDQAHQFQLTVAPGGKSGVYQSELEWTIVKAPG
ncbi:MAG TPA: hypothetical protein DEQ57_07170 [Enterococcus sp.]|nr:hypothetical protein [Enterococcus sp.]